MKAFRFKKVSEKSQNMYRTLKETFDKHFTLEIDKQDDFNCIEICNPKSSNFIYEISDLRIDLKSSNNLSLLMGNSLHGTEFNSEKQSFLIFTYLMDDELNEQSIELASIEARPYEYNYFLQEYYVLLLPGGSLFITSENPLNIDALSFKWSCEEI